MHTPGPWRYDPKEGAVITSQQIGPNPPGASLVAYYGGDVVCESVSTRANGRLIAAAPELYKMLRAIVGPQPAPTSDASRLLARIDFGSR